jgi:hypothetical protein
MWSWWRRRPLSKALLGFLWQKIPRLLFSSSERVHRASCACLGALGAAIYSARRAVFVSDPGAKPVRKRAQRGARRAVHSFSERDASAQTAPSTINITPLILLEWAEGLLSGGKCAFTGESLTPDERIRVLQSVQAMTVIARPEVEAELSAHVMHFLQNLLDAEVTAICDLAEILNIMLATIVRCKPQAVGKLLPDIVDVFLGWALDPKCSQPLR